MHEKTSYVSYFLRTNAFMEFYHTHTHTHTHTHIYVYIYVYIYIYIYIYIYTGEDLIAQAKINANLWVFCKLILDLINTAI